MRLIFVILFFASPTLFGQDMTNSIGVVTLTDNGYSQENGMLEFLNEDGTVWYKMSFYYDDSDGEWDYPNEDFNVLAFHPDMFLLKLRCVSENEDFFEVIVNEKSELTKRIKRTAYLALQTWEQYILSAVSISFESLNNPVLNKAGGENVEVSLPEYPVFEPLELQGEWMKIKWAIDGYPKENSKYNYGWIRWKSYKRILIYTFYTL